MAEFEVRAAAHVLPEGFDERPVGRGFSLEARAGEGLGAPQAGIDAELLRQPRLADTGLANKHHDGTAS